MENKSEEPNLTPSNQTVMKVGGGGEKGVWYGCFKAEKAKEIATKRPTPHSIREKEILLTLAKVQTIKDASFDCLVNLSTILLPH